MPPSESAYNKHADQAQSTMRILGICLNVLGGLMACCLSAAAMEIIGGGKPVASWLLATLSYLVPGIALVVLSRQVGEQRFGATVAALVISILVLLYMLVLFVSGLVLLTGKSAGGAVIVLLIALLLGFAATFAAIYCGKSLAWIKHAGPVVRGFEIELKHSPNDTQESK